VLDESGRAPDQALQGWVSRHQKAVDHLRQTVADMRSLPEMDFATLSVALQAVRRMAEG
jgi:NAD-specific glutamate dehydrogenase